MEDPPSSEELCLQAEPSHTLSAADAGAAFGDPGAAGPSSQQEPHGHTAAGTSACYEAIPAPEQGARLQAHPGQPSTTTSVADMPAETYSAGTSSAAADSSNLEGAAAAPSSAETAAGFSPQAAAAAAAPSQLGSPARSSSTSSSRRGSRSRVGEAPPASAGLPAQVLPPPQLLASTPAGLVTAQAAQVAGGSWDACMAGAAAEPAGALQAQASGGGEAGAAGWQQPQQDTAPPCGVVAPSYHRAASSSILSLHIHGTSQLVPDLLLTDPVMRLHVVHAATGEYVRVLQQLDQQVPPAQKQHAQQHRASAGGSGNGGGSSSPAGRQTGGSTLPRARHPISTDTQAELLDYPGRPALSTLDNNTPNPKPGLLEYIPAVQTRPFNITSTDSAGSCQDGSAEQQRGPSAACDSSSAGIRLGLSASWEEQLCVDAAPEQLVESDALLLLELLQLPSGFARFKRHPRDFGKSGAGHSIAWAFLRLSGLQQKQLLLGQQPLKLRLQLYEYSPGAVRPQGLMSPRLAVPHPESPAKAAYLSFKLSGLLSHPSSSSSSSSSSSITNATASSTTGSPARAGSAQAAVLPQSRGAGSSATTGSSGGSSPWRAGLWSPWGAQGAGLGPNPAGLHGRMPAQGLAAGVSKYPAYVEVTLAAVPRPPGAVVVSDPAAGIRPALPAGYGSGFEIGRMPVSLLYMPRAMRGSRGSAGGFHSTRGSAGGALCVDSASDGAADESLLLLESRLHRPHTHKCQVPNALLAEVKGTAGGCSAISISRDGRWLAAACGDDKGRFQVVLYQALTGRLCWVLGSHAGMVHSITWAKDDSAVVTASADFTAKVWLLPELPGPPSADLQSSALIRHRSGQMCSRAGLLRSMTAERMAGGSRGSAGGVASAPGSPTRAFYAAQQVSADGGAAMGCSGSLGATAAAAGVGVCVLQHTCFVYAAELHPTLQPLPTVVTAGFDGVVRLWTLEGVVLYSLLVSDVPVNCVAFDQLGTRLFAGDAGGVLTELSVDLTPLLAPGSWSQSGWASAAGAGSSPGGIGPDSSCGAAGGGYGDAIAATGAGASSPGLSSSGGAAAIVTVLRHGSNALQQLAGAQLMRKLRSSQELAGCPIMTLVCHPGGHHLIALARSPKGVSDLVALDAKLLLVARRFTGTRCSNAPIKFAVSPDGQYILCGSEDGGATIWDFATATPTPMPHMTLGHAPTHSMAWSSCFQAVAVCSFSHYAPVRVLAFAPEQPAVALNQPSAPAQQQNSKVSQDEVLATSELHRPLRCPLPDQLTPAHVQALLSDLRLSASQRGLYQVSDPHGQQLMVPAHTKQHLPRRLGSRPATADASAAAARAGSLSSGGASKQQQAVIGATAQLSVAGGGAAAAAASSQPGELTPRALQSQKGSLKLQVAPDGVLDVAQGAGPVSPRVVDGTPRSGAAAVAAPWQS